MAHILMAIRNFGQGGAERMVLRAAAGLVDRGHQVDIVIFEPTVTFTDDIPRKARFVILCGQRRWARQKSDTIPEHAQWQGERVPVNRLVRPIAKLFGTYGSGWPLILMQRRVLAYALRLARYLEREQPDVIFGNLKHAQFAAFLGARMALASIARPPIVPIIHGVLRPNSSYVRNLRLLKSEPVHFVAVSQSVAERLSSACHIPETMITTIPNPVFSTSIARQAEVPPDHPWFSDGGPPIILSAGRLEAEKDPFTLLDAYDTFQRAGYRYRLIVLGEGTLRSALEERVRSLGLAGQVSLPGWVENPFAFMSRSALFVLASRSEAFGMVLVEAMACGCPTVATDCQGPSVILDDPDLLAPVGDSNALAQVMQRALNRPRDIQAIRARAAHRTGRHRVRRADLHHYG